MTDTRTTAVLEPAKNDVVPVRRQLMVADDGPLAYLFDTARFEHMQRIAGLMASASFTPAHLVGADKQTTIANCFRVANQAIRWGFDPFVVADETYVVQGRLGYQGKLVIAVINSRAGLQERLSFSFSGTGPQRQVTVFGHFKDERDPRTIQLTVEQAKTGNKMWTTDPDQKLVYSGAIKWARRHCPEVVMGVLTEDDLERAMIGDRSQEPPIATTGRVSLKSPKANGNGEPNQEESHGNGAAAHETDPTTTATTQPATTSAPTTPAEQTTKTPADGELASDSQLQAIDSLKGVMDAEEFEFTLEGYGVGEPKDLTHDQAAHLIDRLERATKRKNGGK